jgi:hypothetical protein
MVVGVAESHHPRVLDIVIIAVNTPHSSSADDGDPQLLNGTKGVAAHCERMDRRPKFISAASSISLIDKCLEIG